VPFKQVDKYLESLLAEMVFLLAEPDAASGGVNLNVANAINDVPRRVHGGQAAFYP